jgi:hypothetical protein
MLCNQIGIYVQKVAYNLGYVSLNFQKIIISVLIVFKKYTLKKDIPKTVPPLFGFYMKPFN